MPHFIESSGHLMCSNSSVKPNQRIALFVCFDELAKVSARFSIPMEQSRIVVESKRSSEVLEDTSAILFLA